MKLFDHQVKALEETEKLKRVAYYLDMGLGKTYVGSEKMMSIGNRINLLICQKSKIDDWIQHFDENYDQSVWIYDLTKPKELNTFIDLIDHPAGLTIVGIINYELAWRRKELTESNNFTLMLDESSLIQNTKAKQTKFVLKLNPDSVILLSGTPTGGKYENLWSQSHLLGWLITEDLYLKHYVNYKLIQVGKAFHKTVDKDNPYKNVDRLKEKLRSHGAVFMETADVMDLPTQTFKEVNVAQSALYKKFMKTSVLKIGDKELIGDTALTKRLYARQLCGQYSDEKLSAFIDLLNSTNDRLIVFYNFNDELDQLKHVCDQLNRPVSQVNGQVKDLTAYDADSDSVTLIQYQAGSMGLNLQKSNKIIYYSLPERSELFEQSKKRIHRIGQDRPCFYYVMMCKGTVERSIYETLKLRKDYTDELFKEIDT